MRAIERLEIETRQLHGEMDAEVAAVLGARTPAGYQRYLARTYGFVAPLERCLADTPGLAPFLDGRRLLKHLLIEHDLQTLGLKQLEIQSIPQCMWIPWFDNPFVALGWAYIVERTTLEHPNLFRHLASALPGEAAFAASYLKVYAGSTHEMWQSFADGLELASSIPHHFDLLREGTRAGYRFFRRWRNTLDGKALSGPQARIAEQAEQAPPTPEAPVRADSSVPEE
jgi:heme oxygenase